MPRASLNPASPGSLDVVVPFSKTSLLLVSHSQCWTRWPAASSSFAATERVDGADGFDEGVAIVEGDLHLEPLDVAGIPLELPRFDHSN